MRTAKTGNKAPNHRQAALPPPQESFGHRVLTLGRLSLAQRDGLPAPAAFSPRKTVGRPAPCSVRRGPRGSGSPTAAPAAAAGLAPQGRSRAYPGLGTLQGHASLLLSLLDRLRLAMRLLLQLLLPLQELLALAQLYLQLADLGIEL